MKIIKKTKAFHFNWFYKKKPYFNQRIAAYKELPDVLRHIHQHQKLWVYSVIWNCCALTGRPWIFEKSHIFCAHSKTWHWRNELYWPVTASLWFWLCMTYYMESILYYSLIIKTGSGQRMKTWQLCIVAGVHGTAMEDSNISSVLEMTYNYLHQGGLHPPRRY